MGVLLESTETGGEGRCGGRAAGEGERMDGRGGGVVVVVMARWWPTRGIGEGAMVREGVKVSRGEGCAV